MTAPSTTSTPPPDASAAPVGPAHGCVRCGAPVALDVAMCEDCNPLALAQPSASQVHGTVALGVGAAVIGLALLASVALAGIGPFRASVASVAADPPGLNVTLSVTNEGSRAGATTCRVYDPVVGISVAAAIMQTPRIEPGATITFNRRVTEFGDDHRTLAVECRDL